MSIRRVSSVRHVSARKRLAIIDKAEELGVITPSGRCISMVKMPALHSYTQETLGMELDDRVLRMVLNGRSGIGATFCKTPWWRYFRINTPSHLTP